jgi:3-hydroxyisobutyrate dehydrogenase
MRAGFAGVGSMGAAMASRALQDGLSVEVFDVNASATGALAEQGATVAASPRELAEHCDIVAVIVLNDDQVRSVVCGEDGLLSAERDHLDIMIHSTIHIPTLLEVAAAARERGFRLIDAGVSGHTTGAARGQLAVMAGGPEEDVDRCRAVLETYGGLVMHVGPLGAGMKAKIARNLLSFAQVAAIYEGMRVAEEAGVDLKAYAQIVRHSEAQSHLLDGFLGNPSVREGSEASEWGRQRLATANAVVETAHKDLSAALDLGASLGLKLPVAEAAHSEVPATWGAEPGPKV